jgi:hypothetical protein
MIQPGNVGVRKIKVLSIQTDDRTPNSSSNVELWQNNRKKGPSLNILPLFQNMMPIIFG